MSVQPVTAPFASLIRERRNAIGVTQEDLARQVGCPQQTIEKIESGKTRKSGYLPDIFSILGLDLRLLTGSKAPARRPSVPRKFVRNGAMKFYVKNWREFMGVSITTAAEAAGLREEEYEAHEVYPINFTLEQVFRLAEAIGVRGDQFWFPPPKRAIEKTQQIIKPRAKRAGR